ncbi:MAG: hypothetical protein M1161_01190 [Candidatus Thermoplasmatota archaeon]|jgi:ABC-type phosphate/phosphonate transport system permease subunit|nr:hypothetical protein [Candidatus Thermoplasmatota archaeon]
MWEILSDGFGNGLIGQRLSVKNSRSAISMIALLDLLVIVPSIVMFLAFNLKMIGSFGLPFLITVLSFLFYLPLGIFYASYFLSKREVQSSSEVAKNKALPMILFLMLIFVMLGIYTPSIGTLTHLIPSFSFLNIPGFVIVFVNLAFIIKNFPKVAGD